MKNTTETSALSLLANDAGYDPLEDRLRENIRSTIEAVFEEELAQFLGRCRYGREDALRQGYRNGHRERQLTGTFGTERVSVPRARIVEEDGRASEWRSRALPRYQRLTRKAEALIASVYLSGTNTRRVKRALFGLFRGAVAVPNSYRYLERFANCVRRQWLRSLRRRSQKDRTTWADIAALTAAHWPRLEIRHPWPDRRLAVSPTQGRSRMP